MKCRYFTQCCMITNALLNLPAINKYQTKWVNKFFEVKSSSSECLWSIYETIAFYFLNNRVRFPEYSSGYCWNICWIFGKIIFNFLWLSKSVDRKVCYQCYCALWKRCFKSITKMLTIFFRIFLKHVDYYKIQEIRKGTSGISHLRWGSVLTMEKMQRELKNIERT